MNLRTMSKRENKRIRLNGVNLPFLGLSWEYIDSNKKNFSLLMPTGQKLKVFISSRHGLDKYQKVRKELKTAIEDTNLAEVSISKQTLSTIPDEVVILDCDICIFLIDNSDGIDEKLQKESEIARKSNKNSLYYFCDEKVEEKTTLEISLMGSQFAKSKTVHKFDDLGKDGANVIINDILAIYHYYCTGKMTFNGEYNEDLQTLDVKDIQKYQLANIPKMVIKNIDKCRNYIMNFILGNYYNDFQPDINNTNDIDEWGFQFLSVLFEGISIKKFNTELYLEILEKEQEKDCFQIVQIRWKAIQYYFLGDIEKSIDFLEVALNESKKTNQATWLIKDIQIDLRNLYVINNNIKNIFNESKVQKELNESDEELYYPILDRIHESLHGKIIDELYKSKIESPYTVEIGNNLYRFGEMIASSFIVAMYNGSLTHILYIYNRLKNFAFYLCCKYDDKDARINLYKLAIFSAKEKEIKGIRNSYPDLLNDLNSKEAISIMKFCENHPIEQQRFNSQLLAFSAVGYYLSDKDFDYYNKYIVDKIIEWLNSENPTISIGQNIFRYLSDVAHRMSQNTISDICCQFIDKCYRRWYRDMFIFIHRHIDLHAMDELHAKKLISRINYLIDNEENIKDNLKFLCTIRKQNNDLTEEMNKKISEKFPVFYNGTYKLETTNNMKEDYPMFVEKSIDQIKKRNMEQGKNGVFHCYATNEIATVRAILLDGNVKYESKLMDNLIYIVSETIMHSKENISTKLDAVSLLLCVKVRYPNDYRRNINIYEKIYEERNKIEISDDSIGSSNITNISLKIGLSFLYMAIGKDVYSKIVELMSYIDDDDATTIAVTQFIFQYLCLSDNILLPTKIDVVVLQKTIQWLNSEYFDIIWNSTRILFMLSRNLDNCEIINHQIINIVDSSSMYIKNLLIRSINSIKGIKDSTIKYVINKCKQDDNYIVRTTCNEIEMTNALNDKSI